LPRSKKKAVGKPAVTPLSPVRPPVAEFRPGVGGWAAGIGIAICIALTWLSRLALNVDGVAYLDLARAARAGDWRSFVQGYWSPLYPAIIGGLSAITGGTPASLIALSHFVNLIAAIAAIILLWWWGRQSARPYFTPAILAVFLLASTGLPRIEAVTPDVLLLAAMSWIGFEFLHHRGQRVLPTGLAMGLSFLAKTSVWPWFLLSIPLRLWSADGPKERRGVLVSTGVALILAGIWVVPLSLKTGGPTLGSAGRLNYEWYIESSDARTPDTHTGHHEAARSIPIDSARSVEVLTFVGADRWTYAPWSDPTAWNAGILSSNASPPLALELIAYWGRQARRTFGFWILPVLLGVLLPCALAFGSGGLPSRLIREQRTRTTTLLLGLAGILQFVAVHSEPRLIAPFVLLLGFAALDAIFPSIEQRSGGATRVRVAISVAWLVVLWLSIIRLSAGVKSEAQIEAATDRILANQTIAAFNVPQAQEILVAGPAMPIAPAAFLAGVRIVGQMPPASLLLAQSLTPDQQETLLREAAAGRVRIVWITDWTGAVRVVQIPAP